MRVSLLRENLIVSPTLRQDHQVMDQDSLLVGINQKQCCPYTTTKVNNSLTPGPVSSQEPEASLSNPGKEFTVQHRHLHPRPQQGHARKRTEGLSL